MNRAEFLEDRIANCERNLDKPNVRYPNGRMSHDVERDALNEATAELLDMRLDGFYRADGSFAAYAEEDQ